MEDFSQVTWIAVVVGTVAAFIFGWVWYHPKTMGTKWAKGTGVDLNNMTKMPVFPMLAQLLALFFLAMVIGLTASINALITAIFAILAAATFVASSGSFSQKSTGAVMIDFFYVFFAGVIMIVCQGIF